MWNVINTYSQNFQIYALENVYTWKSKLKVCTWTQTSFQKLSSAIYTTKMAEFSVSIQNWVNAGIGLCNHYNGISPLTVIWIIQREAFFQIKWLTRNACYMKHWLTTYETSF